MTIYIDIIFLENIIMNFIILLSTGLVLREKISYTRIFVASILGSIYVVVTYITNLKSLFGIFMKILLSIAMTYIAFNSKKVKTHLKEILTFYLVSFAFGGAAIATIYFVKPQNILIKNGVYVGRYATTTILLGAILGFILVNIVFKIIKKKITKSEMNCIMKVKLDEREETVKVMLDTGNMLKDPITRKPVAIIDIEIAEKLLPEKLIKNMHKILGGEFNTEDEKINKYISKLKIVPFSSLGKEHGLIIAFKPDIVKIEYEEEIIEINNILIGISEKKLFKNSEYNGLIGLEILNGGTINNEYSELIKN